MNSEEKILAMLTQMQEAQRQMSEAQKRMQDDISTIKIRLDYDVDKRFDAINEGIDTILEWKN